MADPVRLRAERLATASSCCGFLGEVMLTDSAVIILFAGMLGVASCSFPFIYRPRRDCDQRSALQKPITKR